MPAPFVESDANVPLFGQQTYFFGLNPFNESKVSLAKLKVVLRKLHSNDVQSDEVSCKLSVVGRTVVSMEQSSEQTFHQ